MSAQLTAGQAMWGGDPDKDVRLYRSLGHLLQSFERQERLLETIAKSNEATMMSEI